MPRHRQWVDACSVKVDCFFLNENQLKKNNRCRDTDVDGRIADLVTPAQFPPGIYKLVFKTGDYYGAKNIPTMYPYIEIIFERSTPDQILIVVSLSPYGYSVYKGVNTFK